jgi:transcriptional regulator with XRE-family HTH domain
VISSFSFRSEGREMTSGSPGRGIFTVDSPSSRSVTTVSEHDTPVNHSVTFGRSTRNKWCAKMTHMEIHERVAELIERSGIPQAEIARRMGQSRTWLNHRLTGEVDIKARELFPLAEALRVDPCALLESGPPDQMNLERAIIRLISQSGEGRRRVLLRLLTMELEGEGDSG